ncbi:unnamed protein product, partial [Prorocentrum cordatum]
ADSQGPRGGRDAPSSRARRAARGQPGTPAARASRRRRRRVLLEGNTRRKTCTNMTPRGRARGGAGEGAQRRCKKSTRTSENLALRKRLLVEKVRVRSGIFEYSCCRGTGPTEG